MGTATAFGGSGFALGGYVHQARQKCRAERAALEAAYNLGSVKTGVVSNAAFTTQARKAARQLNVTRANPAKIAALFETAAEQ